MPAGVYLLKVSNKNTRMRCEICSKLTINTLESYQLVRFYINWRFQGRIDVNSIEKNSFRREIRRHILIAVTLFPTLSEPFDGINNYFTCNEIFHCGKCELLCSRWKSIFAASTESLENRYKVFLKTRWIFNLTDFLTLTALSWA